MSRGRTFVIGDIHGCARTFIRLLEQIELTPADTLYLLGDLIDRGPDSKGVVNIILGMLTEGIDVRPVRGNHEHLLLLAIQSEVFEDLFEWLENGGDVTLKSYGVQHPQDIPEHHLRFLESLPMYRVTNDFVFVHAGIDCSLANPFSASGTRHMLWDRSGLIDVGKLGGRKVVSGHSTRTLDDIKKSLKKNHLRVDNGVYLAGVPGKGRLVAVDLGTGELFVQPNVEKMPDS
jgi:serine/threonine protein phosphatase 1